MDQDEVRELIVVKVAATMRALEQTSLKGPQDLRLITDAPVPSPGPGEVLIRVAAAGINFADLSRAHGTFFGGPQPPYLAGFEAAGLVVAVGDAVTRPQPGTLVIGVGQGAFAQYAVLPAAVAMPVPAGWSADQALGLVVNWPTALAALKPLGHIASGETVHAADRPPRRVAPGEVRWLEPLPDHWITPPDEDPAAVVVARESLRLALIASLQHLPARQRAILILREVLAFSSAETAQILGTTTAAVKSGLQRARTRLVELEPERGQLLEPADQRARALLDGYIAAFEHSDAGLLAEVLRADATLEATPFRDWQAGRVDCVHMLDAYVLGEPGDWRMVATSANGQPAAAVYFREEDGELRAHGIVLLDPAVGGISRAIAFHHDPALVAMFGFPDVLAD